MNCCRYAVVVALAAAIFLPINADARTLRIVSYNIDCADQSSDNNITGTAHTLPTVIQAIGLHHIGTNAQQADIITCEELQSTTLANFAAALNNIYGAGAYTYDPTTDPNTGGGPDGIIYNTATIQIVSARALKTGQTVLLQSNGTYTAAHSPGGGVNGVARAPMVYQVRPVGSDSSADFYMYVSHARSSSDDSVGDARYAEAQEVRSDAKYNLPASAHILYCGDWNLFSGSGENAYKCLTGQVTSDAIDWSDGSAVWANANPTQAYDPTSKTSPPTTNSWANVSGDNATYLYGDSTSSLTSRIDIQLPNKMMYAAYNSLGGVQLAPDTSDPYDSANFPSSKYPYAYEVFGNNGTTPRSSAVTSTSNHSLNDLASTSPNASTTYSDILQTGSGATSTGSDHYPLVSDWLVITSGPQAQLGVTPSTGLASSGAQGGAFTPNNQVYTLTNSGTATLNWTASKTANWLTLSATSGTLAVNSSTTVTASINANANSLAAGSYSDTIGFTNTNNGAGNSTRAVSLTVTNINTADPNITSQPTSATFVEGTTGALNVTASGTQPISYQWQKNDGTGSYTNILSATSSIYSKTISSSDAGSYRVVVSNVVSTATSSAATITVTALSTDGIRLSTLTAYTYTQNFDSLPTTSTGYTWANNSTVLGWYADKSGGTTGSFSIVDNGSSTSNGLHDYGATSATDRSLGATADSGGTMYWANVAFGVRFVNDLSVGVSNMTVVFTGKQWRQTTNSNTLQFYYRITNGPATTIDASNNFVWTAASSLNFASLHTGTVGALDGTSAVNQSAKSNSIANLNLPAANELWLRWFLPSQYPSPGLAIDSLTVIFGVAPAITAQPQSQTVVAGQSAVLSVSANGTAPLSYQWKKGGVSLANGGSVSGAATANLTLSSASQSDVGSYSVVVTNSVGVATSTTATLTVSTPPGITSSPQSATILQGHATTFTVTATNASSYQWLFNGAPINSATSTTLAVRDAQPTDAGSYSVVVSNSVGGVTSAPAVLTVLGSPISLASITPNADGSMTLVWNVDVGNDYTLQYKDDLEDFDWNDVATVTANSSTLTISDPSAGSPTNVQRFYQLYSTERTSDVAGFLNLSLLGDSDNFVSPAFVRPSAGLQLVGSVFGATITASGLPNWSANQFVYSGSAQSNTWYLRFVSGNYEGRMYPITANDTNSITVDPGNDMLLAVAPNDEFSIEPYWTFATMFPEGAGVNVSPTLGNRNTEVLLPDLTNPGINLSATKIYFFNAGTWKQVGQGTADHDDDVIPLDSYLAVRHNVSTNTTVTLTGVVVSSQLLISLRTQSDVSQDNALALLRPIAVSLNDSGLINGGAFQPSPLPGTRTDELLTFDNNAVMRNKSASAVYYYWSNAWREVGLGNTDVGGNLLAPGTGFIIRKSTNSVPAIWTNAPNW